MSSSCPTISVVVPLFNAEAYVERCLEALLAQDYPSDRYEILVVDNGSADATRRIAERFPRVRLLDEPQRGSYAARNRALAEVTGELVAFTDSDCEPCAAWLASIARALAPPEAMIVLGKRTYAAPSRGLALLADYEATMIEQILSSDRGEIYFGYTNNMGVRASLFEELGPFVEVGRGADTVFVQDAVKARGCEAVRFSADVAVRHLEIRGVLDFYKKRYLYGASNQRNRKRGSARPLGNAERLRNYLATLRARDYGVGETTQLLVLLAAGLLFYEAGRWRGHRSSSKEKLSAMTSV